MSEHTLLPWVISGHYGLLMSEIYAPGSSRAVATVWTKKMAPSRGSRKGEAVAWPEGEANAEFIVRACNAHQNLLEALTLAIRYLEHPDVQALPFALPASVPLEKARAAVAMAKGKPRRSPA